MNPFQYISARNADDAVALAGPSGRYLAGGIDLLSEMKDYIVSPDLLVGISGLPAGPGRPAAEAAGAQNGTAPSHSFLDATMTIADLAASELKKALPGLCEAAAEVGSPQIRNVATVAGNLLQHSRCWYYRQPDLVCLKRGGEKCYAPEGENKYLSLFSGCDCVSPIVSNLSVILTALEAEVEVRSGADMEKLGMAKFYAEAWKNPQAHHSLKPQEFVLGVQVPLGRAQSAYRQQSEKSGFDWALVSCAAAANVTDGKIYDARLVLGAVAPVPYMIEEANHFLEGKPLDEETASRAADILLKEAKPLAQNGYKIPLAHTLIRRTLLALNA